MEEEEGVETWVNKIEKGEYREGGERIRSDVRHDSGLPQLPGQTAW